MQSVLRVEGEQGHHALPVLAHEIAIVELVGQLGGTHFGARGKHIGEVNSARRPWTSTIDLRFNKDFHFFGLRQRFFVDVWNVLDRTNVYQVFSNSGKPDYSVNPQTSEENMHRPHWYGPPRQIEVGLEVGF